VGRLVAMWTGRLVEKSVVKFTGRPITLRELVEALELVFSGKKERVVLSYGA
jgi:2-oxoglutarate ferredoxin oxidoreductase subunit alpha